MISPTAGEVRTVRSQRVRARRWAWIGLTNLILIAIVCVVALSVPCVKR